MGQVISDFIIIILVSRHHYIILLDFRNVSVLVCLSVCPSVCLHVLRMAYPNFVKFAVRANLAWLDLRVGG